MVPEPDTDPFLREGTSSDFKTLAYKFFMEASASVWYPGYASGSASASNKNPDPDQHPDPHQYDANRHQWRQQRRNVGM
jgi:hypothetical protein